MEGSAAATSLTTARSIELEPALAQLAGARRFIAEGAEAAGFTAARVFDIMVASSEAMANAVEHALGNSDICVTTSIHDDRYEVSVQGTGRFEMPDRSARREHRGLGLPLMAKLSDHLTLYSAPQGGTLVTLTFFREGHDSLPVESPLPPALLEVLENSDRLQALLDTVPGAFGILDADLRRLYLNERAVTEDGRDAVELAGRPVAEGRPDLVESGFVSILDHARESPAPLREELYNPIRRSWSDVTAFRFGDGVAYFGLQIDERKRAEALIEQRTVELEAANARLLAEMAEHAADEKALEESRQKFQQLVETNVDMIWEIDTHGCYTYCSPQMEKFWNTTGREIIGTTLFDTMLESDVPRVKAALRRFVERARPFHGLRVTSHDAQGRVIHFEVNGAPIIDETGRVTGFRGSTRDVTERMVAAQVEERYRVRLEREVQERTAELETSRRMLEAVIEAQAVSLVALVAVRDAKGGIVDLEYTFASPMARRMAGDALTGRRFSSVFPYREQQAVLAAFKRVVETGESLDREFRYTNDRESGWFRCIAVRLGDGLVLNTEDITLRKRAEADLLHAHKDLARAATDRYLTLFESIDEGFTVIEVLFDAVDRPVDYRYIEVNAAFERHTGLRDVIGRTGREVVPDVGQDWIALCANVAVTRRPARTERPLRSLGRHYDVHVFAVGAPEERRVAVLFNDITERKLAEQALRESNEELLRFNRVAVGRELRMIELKQEINELCAEAGLPARYGLSRINDQTQEGWR